ncbi:MAG: cell division protein ZapA [Clostridia bacterium]|jgi:cell division protein ZapA|nr:cell division protein ZapA [Clostridia bacterium]
MLTSVLDFVEARCFLLSDSKEAVVKVTVNIHGQEYTIKGNDSEEYIKKLADYVDEKMREIASKNSNLPPIKVAVLAALNLADELHKTAQEYKWLLQLIEEEKKT